MNPLIGVSKAVAGCLIDAVQEEKKFEEVSKTSNYGETDRSGSLIRKLPSWRASGVFEHTSRYHTMEDLP